MSLTMPISSFIRMLGLDIAYLHALKTWPL